MEKINTVQMISYTVPNFVTFGALDAKDQSIHSFQTSF